jgi:hypothetical protein
MTTQTRAEYGSQTPSLEKLNNGQLSWIARMENEFLAQHNLDTETKHCPRCDRNRLKKFFGVRIMREPKTGKPLKARFQSYCVDCRSLKPGQEPGTKKGAKAKKAGKAKVRAQVKAGKAKVVAEETPAPAPTELAPVVLGGEPVQAPPTIEIPVVAVEPAPVVEAETVAIPEDEPQAPEVIPEVVAATAETMEFPTELELAPIEVEPEQVPTEETLGNG